MRAHTGFDNNGRIIIPNEHWRGTDVQLRAVYARMTGTSTRDSGKIAVDHVACVSHLQQGHVRVGGMITAMLARLGVISLE